MLDIDMTRTTPFALLRAAGKIESTDEVETFVSALEFVPRDDDLVVELRAIDALSSSCASGLRTSLQERVGWSDAVVVASNDRVMMQLLEGEVDRVVPIVAELHVAADLLRARRGSLAIGAMY
ncbi:MAG: hypothetical protein HZB15_00035 [Actinobacteria bacterium]|nr:hypothetical protein [Actinomycetota bacterium]